MTWREDLRRVTIDGKELVGASFRGITFLVEDETLSGGRRLVVHEFPFRNAPVIQDMGRQARRYRVEAFLVGDEYLAQRDALLEAIEEEGAGILVHPEYSEDLRVRVGGYSVQSSRREVAIARISIEFVESPLDVITLALEDAPDLPSLLSMAAQAADAANETELVDGFQVIGVPGYARQSQADDMATFAQRLGDALGALDVATQERAHLQVAIANIVNDALSLVGRPEDVMSAFRATTATVPDLIAAVPRSVIAALIRAHDTEAPLLAEATTDIRAIERENQILMSSMLRRWAITSAAQIAASTAYVTEEDALEDREAIVDRIEVRLDDAGDGVFPHLRELRAAVALAIPGNQELARVREVERPTAIPALLLSYNLYGTTDQEDNILDRNNVQHPSFLRGTINVLSEAV